MKTRSIIVIENSLRSTISHNERTISELEKKIVFLKQDTQDKKEKLKEIERIQSDFQQIAQQIAGALFSEIEVPEFLAKELPFREPILKEYPEGFYPTVLVSRRKKQSKVFCKNCSVCISGEFEYQVSKTDPTRCMSCSEKYNAGKQL